MNTLILAGGESRRMGQPKALLPYQGRPFIRYLTDRLQSVSDDSGSCIVVTRNELLKPIRSVVDPRIQVIQDIELYKGLGPLAGIYSGIQQLVNTTPLSPWFTVLACDMPYFSVPLLLKMESITNQYDDIVDAFVFPNQPFHGFYHTRILPVLAECLNERKLSFRDFFQRIRIHELPFDTDFERAFFNMNTPEEYQELLRGTEE